jgi:hypothetical protein
MFNKMVVYSNTLEKMGLVWDTRMGSDAPQTRQEATTSPNADLTHKTNENPISTQTSVSRPIWGMC